VSSVAPDARQAAVLEGDELWVVDLVRSVPMRLPTDLARQPTTDDAFKGVTDWSSDGRYLVFKGRNAETNLDLWILPRVGELEPGPPHKVGDWDDPDVTSGARLPNGRGALVNVAHDRRPRDIRLILDWTALLGE
jgi:hypothetical protein